MSSLLTRSCESIRIRVAQLEAGISRNRKQEFEHLEVKTEAVFTRCSYTVPGRPS